MSPHVSEGIRGCELGVGELALWKGSKETFTEKTDGNSLV